METWTLTLHELRFTTPANALQPCQSRSSPRPRRAQKTSGWRHSKPKDAPLTFLGEAIGVKSESAVSYRANRPHQVLPFAQDDRTVPDRIAQTNEADHAIDQ